MKNENMKLLQQVSNDLSTVYDKYIHCNDANKKKSLEILMGNIIDNLNDYVNELQDKKNNIEEIKENTLSYKNDIESIQLNKDSLASYDDIENEKNEARAKLMKVLNKIKDTESEIDFFIKKTKSFIESRNKSLSKLKEEKEEKNNSNSNQEHFIHLDIKLKDIINFVNETRDMGYYLNDFNAKSLDGDNIKFRAHEGLVYPIVEAKEDILIRVFNGVFISVLENEEKDFLSEYKKINESENNKIEKTKSSETITYEIDESKAEGVSKYKTKPYMLNKSLLSLIKKGYKINEIVATGVNENNQEKYHFYIDNNFFDRKNKSYQKMMKKDYIHIKSSDIVNNKGESCNIISAIIMDSII